MEVITNRKITWEVKNDFGYLYFVDHPENRMDTQFFAEFKEITSEVMPDSKVKALILSGSGRHFSSGANLEELYVEIKKTKDTGRETLLVNYQPFQYLDQLNIPVIAAIKGVCMGSALELAMHCHFRLCSSEAILGLPESSFGLIPGLGGISKMMELSGKARAMELILRGHTFPAADALQWGLVDAIFPKKELMNRAEQLATIASVGYRRYNKIEILKTLNTP